jgi:tetratricopeptide (TPR) repeat protein
MSTNELSLVSDMISNRTLPANRPGEQKSAVKILLALMGVALCTFLPAKSARGQEANLAELSAQGKAALKDQQFDRAEKIYEQVVKLEPRSAEAHSNLGLSLYMSAQYSRAISELKKALELDPHLDHTRVLLALSYFDSGDYEHATPLLEKAYQTMKDDPVVAAHLGLVYLRAQNDDKALAVLSHWVELEPNSPDALYFKGKAAVYLASDSFSKLTKVAPDSYRMFQLRAEMLRQQGLLPAAINEYKQAIAQKPDIAGLHYALGTLYREAGRLDEALDEFHQELKISPNDALTNYFIGDICLQKNDITCAEQSLSLALAAQPGLSDAQLDMAKIYKSQGKPAEAIKLLQAVVAAEPDQQDAHYLLFTLYRDQGQTENARKELQLFETLKRNADREVKPKRTDALN